MSTWKKALPNKIRNIKLVSEEDEGYSSFMEEIKLANVHIRPKNARKFSDLISRPIEQTVREWVKLTGTVIDERIISYEILNFNNKYEKRYCEIDFIFLKDGIHYLAEVKTSSAKKRILPKATNQLKNSHLILRRAGIRTELLVVNVNIQYNAENCIFHSFKHNFFEMEFSTFEKNELCFTYLELEPFEVVEWGLRHGTIKDDNILFDALNESKSLEDKRARKQKLIEEGIPRDEWPIELKEDQSFSDGAYILYGLEDSQKDKDD